MDRYKKWLAGLLVFALMFASVYTGNMPTVQAATTTKSTTIKISIADGTTAPENYGVDYELVQNDEAHTSVSEGPKGHVITPTGQQVDFTDVEETYWVKITVTSAGLGVRLNGADVSSEGWTEGKYIALNDLVQEYSFVLFQKAEGNNNLGGQTDTYTIDFSDGTVSGKTITYKVGESDVTLTLPDNVTVNESSIASVGENTEFVLSSNFNSDTMEVGIYGENNFYTTLNVVGGITSIAKKTNNGGIPGSVKLKIQGKNNADPNPQEPVSGFDGIAYFVWKGANDKLCVHKITGLDASRKQGEEIAFDIIYIPVSNVKDDTTNEMYHIDNRDYYWLWSSAESFINENKAGGYRAFKDKLNESENVLRTYAIDPCGAENGASTVCTNGNRDFRATIYDGTSFEGIAFSQSQNDYTYFPDYWDNVFFSSTVDISNTTEENPAVYESFLLEPTIRFSKAVNSGNEITGIKALNVPSGAVTITRSPSEGYSVTFGSNFFDNVEFKITAGNESYYITIVRSVIKVFDTNGPDESNPSIIAQLYYDDTKDYSDYDVYAAIHYQDGTTKLQKMSVSKIEDNGFGNQPPTDTYEWSGGKKLKWAQYRIPMTDEIVGVDFNAVQSGALSQNTAYGGSYFGSGNGVYYNVEARNVEY